MGPAPEELEKPQILSKPHVGPGKRPCPPPQLAPRCFFRPQSPPKGAWAPVGRFPPPPGAPFSYFPGPPKAGPAMKRVPKRAPGPNVQPPAPWGRKGKTSKRSPPKPNQREFLPERGVSPPPPPPPPWEGKSREKVFESFSWSQCSGGAPFRNILHAPWPPAAGAPLPKPKTFFFFFVGLPPGKSPSTQIFRPPLAPPPGPRSAPSRASNRGPGGPPSPLNVLDEAVPIGLATQSAEQPPPGPFLVSRNPPQSGPPARLPSPAKNNGVDPLVPKSNWNEGQRPPEIFPHPPDPTLGPRLSPPTGFGPPPPSSTAGPDRGPEGKTPPAPDIPWPPGTAKFPALDRCPRPKKSQLAWLPFNHRCP